ncbi:MULTISPECIES: hypothetical protein [unclassified Pseudomonas]|uniref:hypothetical protein n=1 Tax=unclassified Pseudomonas TaxID=196821 RepID=UPI002579B18C|nr:MULTISPECIES: hypothetical protein [unclassified Pseudomonas]
MLKHPFLEKPYVPDLNYFLGGIEIYDREETLGEELWKYDPNKITDREEIIKLYIIPSLNNHSYRHKFLLFKELEKLLSTKDHDFSAYFEYLEEEYIALPWYADEIVDARGFFSKIYEIAKIEWKEDLIKAESEDRSAW